MILVFVETAAEGATEVSLETVTFARSLAERTGGPVHAVVVGALPEKLADELGAYGVAEVHHATGDAFSAYAGAAWAAAVQSVAAETAAPQREPGGSGRVRLLLPPAQPSAVDVLGEGPDAAKAMVDLLEKLGVAR